MVVRKLESALLLLLASGVSADSRDTPEIENHISACVALSGVEKRTEPSGLQVLGLRVGITQSLAECGCKSALVAYTVFAKMDGYRSYIIGGKLLLAQSGTKQLPLSADPDLINDKPLAVSFSCAQPD